MSNENQAEITTEEILLERDASIMTDEFDAAKSNEGDLPDEMHNDLQKPAENPDGEVEKKPDEIKKPDDETIKAGRQNGVEKRIGRAVRKQKVAERQVDTLDKENRDLREKLAAKDKDPEPEAPKEDDFEKYTDYVKELTKFEAKQAVNSTQEKPDEKIDDKSNDKPVVVDSVAAVINDVLSDGADKYDDFEEVVRNPKVNITNEILEELIETDSPDDLLYHLAKNPDEVDRLNDLTPKAKAREIAKMEAKLESGEIVLESNSGSEKTVSETDRPEEDGSPAEKQTPKKRTTKAPAPISTLDGEGSHTQKSVNDMTTKEFRAYRFKQEQKRRGH